MRHLVEDQTLFQVDQKAILDEEYDKERYVDLKGDNDEALGNIESEESMCLAGGAYTYLLFRQQ